MLNVIAHHLGGDHFFGHRMSLVPAHDRDDPLPYFFRRAAEQSLAPAG
jgi:hypothetical protein